MRPIAASPFGWPEGFGPGSVSPSRPPSGASLAGPTPRWTTGRYLGGHSPDVLEAERVLSHVAAARDRAEQALRAMRRSGADRTLVEAVEGAERSLCAVQGALVSALDGPGAGPMAAA